MSLQKVNSSTFYRYKPFYVVAASEREKESCLCSICLNAHLLIQPINKYRESLNETVYESVTNYMKEYKNNNSHLPELAGIKIMTYHQYERQPQEYFEKQTGVKKTYNRVKRLDKADTISNITKLLLSMSDNYLLHKFYCKNDQVTWPIILNAMKENNVKYIHIDFSENICMTPKFEPQPMRFSGKQYSLHCSLLSPKNPYQLFFI